MSKTVEKLQSAGIAAADYKRKPKHHPREVFLASIHPDGGPGTIYIFEGEARIHVEPDPKRKQALVTVAESPRVLTRSVSIRTKGRAPTQRQIRAAVNIETPTAVTWRLDGNRWTRGRSPNGERFLQGVVRANVPASYVNLLMGMDETHNFIAGVPGNPRTVVQAQKALQPTEDLPEGTVRQGEWFFVPIDRTTQLLLPRMLDERRMDHRLEGGWHQVHEYGLTHIGNTAVEFARGWVMDRRQGHHATVHLGHGWHRVVRNAELRTLPAIGANARAQRSWD